MAISSKKQWRQVSEAIAKCRPYSTNLLTNGVVEYPDNSEWEYLITVLCSTYMKDNPAFSPERFRLACEIKRGHDGQ